MNEPSTYAAGWFPDPSRRYELRWYNGHSWTGDVSSGGQRFVDPVPAGIMTFSAETSDPGRRPSQTLATVSMIAGLLAVATAWMPIVVVVGGVSAIAAVVLGGVALSRVSSGRAAGRGMAIAGLVLGIAGVALTPIGVVLTGRVVDELIRFAEPGPVSVEVETCAGEDGRIEVSGSIVNLDDTLQSYVIEIELSDIRGRDDVVQVAVDDVEPGGSRTWSTSEASVLDGNLRCRVDVTGPYPFGIRPPERD